MSRMLKKPTFDLALIPVEAQPAAEFLAKLAPVKFANELDARLADTTYAQVESQIRKIRDAAFVLVRRCEVALRRLEGSDAQIDVSDDALEMLVGFRAPIVDMLKGSIAFNDGWLRATNETIEMINDRQHEGWILNPNNRAFYEAFVKERDGYAEARARLSHALDAFRPKAP